MVMSAAVTEVQLPVEYTTAVRSLALCSTLEEAKHWSNKADALAAWAKIYQSDEVAIEAKRLKLHAFRRMSELAEELQPNSFVGKGRKRPPGPADALIKAGLSKSATNTIRRVGAIPQAMFVELIASDNVPGVTAASELGRGAGLVKKVSSGAWRVLTFGRAGGFASLSSFVNRFCRREDAYELAQGIRPEEVAALRKLITEAQAWLSKLDKGIKHGAQVNTQTNLGN
jgi:hypothetical protein